jgi:hypothetical protein
MGLALLSRHFEKSRLPEEMSRLLANDWKGGFVLLVVVAVISSVLDNIAAAFIGSPMAHKGFCGKVHVGYLTGIVATSNAAGSGSVVGDTTSSPLSVLEALVAASVPLVLFGSPATIQRRRYSPNRRECSSSPSSRLQRSPPTYPPSRGKVSRALPRHGWHVAVAYIIGFFVMLSLLGWHPDPPHSQSLVIPGAAVISCARWRGIPLIVLVCPRALLVTHQRPTRLRSTTRRPRLSSLGGPSASLRGY